MTDVALEKLKYPIGRFQWVEQLSPEEIKSLTEEIRSFPAELEAEIQNFKPEDFQKTYRPGAWQIGQLIHHLADSHIHVYTRFKLALTQDTPTANTYFTYFSVPSSRALPFWVSNITGVAIKTDE